VERDRVRVVEAGYKEKKNSDSVTLM
jgi:hypothetical protein